MRPRRHANLSRHRRVPYASPTVDGCHVENSAKVSAKCRTFAAPVTQIMFARRLALAVIVVAMVLVGACRASPQAVLTIGSKRFTESYILGEILTLAAAKGGVARHRPGLGNTAIVFAALQSGDIDLYPEYTG